MPAGPGTLKGSPGPDPLAGIRCLVAHFETLKPKVCSSGAVLFLPKSELARSSPSSRQRRRLQCTAFLGPVSTSLPTATTGWLIAGAVLAAVRLGRKQAEDARLEQLQASTCAGRTDAFLSCQSAFSDLCWSCTREEPRVHLTRSNRHCYDSGCKTADEHSRCPSWQCRGDAI